MGCIEAKINDVPMLQSGAALVYMCCHCLSSEVCPACPQRKGELGMQNACWALEKTPSRKLTQSKGATTKTMTEFEYFTTKLTELKGVKSQPEE
jgi:hypothetical protein